ncbi:MAG: hypothetical protein JW726_07765 [Anaerolineales bacterium]|nr:hypothetical protein [Anaerolineales bacterium]
MKSKTNPRIEDSYIPSEPPQSFSILTANVGNLSLGCQGLLNKLCYKDVEENIARNIQILKPDIIALQEVLAPWQCENITEKNPNKVCSAPQVVPQVRRLLGDDYTISCNSRNQFECIGVRSAIGEVANCSQNQLCNNARTITEIPGCDNGFNVSAITVHLFNGPRFDVVNFHPQSTNAACRAQMISNALLGGNETGSILQEDLILLMGDFNLDPWRDDDESVEVWKNFLSLGWRGSALQYHSGIVEHDPPYITSSMPLLRKTVDFIASNFASGICVVLGETPGTARLDSGSGTDHRAIYGLLTSKP